MSVDLLLVEDEPLDVELIGDALRRAGVEPRLRCVDDEPALRSCDKGVILIDTNLWLYGAFEQLPQHRPSKGTTSAAVVVAEAVIVVVDGSIMPVPPSS